MLPRRNPKRTCKKEINAMDICIHITKLCTEHNRYLHILPERSTICSAKIIFKYINMNIIEIIRFTEMRNETMKIFQLISDKGNLIINNCSPENLPIINKDIQKFQEYYHAYIEKQRMYKLIVQSILSNKLCGDLSRIITDYLNV
jgi:hypothetical protein